MEIRAFIGSITSCDSAVAVNAAKTSLLGGGGVDGAIHHAAGPKLLAECQALPEIFEGERIHTGGAAITKAYDMPNDAIIHTAGPDTRLSDDVHTHRGQLAQCYHNSINLALKHGHQSIAFPAISTGIYGYPLEDATIVAINTVMNMKYILNGFIISFVCFDEANYLVYDRVIQAATKGYTTRVFI